MIHVHQGDNLEVLAGFESSSFELIYIDPPFNTGRTQRSRPVQTEAVKDNGAGDRVGFGGRSYRTTSLGSRAYDDAFDDYLAFIEPRLVEAHRLLSESGSFFLHLDYREVHYCKVLCDAIFGRDCFVNEIIWAYDYGGRSKQRWSPKHDTILWYVKNPASYTFNYDAIDRVPYMAPNLVTPEKAARGKTPTDTWWHTIVPTNGAERTGYPTQKPLGILRRIIAVHSNAGDRILDFFAGSGTTGLAAAEAGRNAVLVDSNPEAASVMKTRFEGLEAVFHGLRTASPAPASDPA